MNEQPAERPTMMTLDRAPGKAIRIDLGNGRTGRIMATIVTKTLRDKTTRQEVRLCIEFPRSVRVDREEIYLERLAKGETSDERGN